MNKLFEKIEKIEKDVAALNIKRDIEYRRIMRNTLEENGISTRDYDLVKKSMELGFDSIAFYGTVSYECTLKMLDTYEINTIYLISKNVEIQELANLKNYGFDKISFKSYDDEWGTKDLAALKIER